MIDHAATGVVHGDQESRDGHYRPKLDLRQQSAESRRAVAARLDDPNDTISIQAQNPEELSGTSVGQAYQEAAGLPAVLKTVEFGIGQMGLLRGTKALLRVNKKDGFDCQSCAWPLAPENSLTAYAVASSHNALLLALILLAAGQEARNQHKGGDKGDEQP